MSAVTQLDKLAIEGGEPAVRHPLPPMYPGGMKIGTEEEEAVLGVIRSRRLFRYYGPEPGPSQVAALEDAFAGYVGTRHCAAVSSGSASLICALAGLAVGPGDEVIVPAYTWIASASAVVAMGAVPVLAEVDESLTLDPDDVERKVSRHTKAIVAVHMRGAPCRMDRLGEVARRHGLWLLEDTAQATGGSYGGRRLGSIGDVGAFSLQFNKIITAGEGGLVTTDDDQIHRRTLMYADVVGGLRNGIPADEILPGINFRMSELQGAVALVQLGRLDDLLAAMRTRKARLKGHLAELARGTGITFRALNDPAGDTGIALIFYLPTAEGARFAKAALRAEGVNAGLLFDPDDTDYHVYYHWAPILEKRTWSTAGGPWRWHEGTVDYGRDACPRTLDLLGRAVNLDVSPELSDENLDDIGAALAKVLPAAL